MDFVTTMTRMSNTDLVVVQTFNSRPEAELARGTLEAAGIDAMVRADDGGTQEPALGWMGLGVQVIVRAEDADAARDILGETDQPA
jgi:Putative prokaryotic signal transducing protein